MRWNKKYFLKVSHWKHFCIWCNFHTYHVRCDRDLSFIPGKSSHINFSFLPNFLCHFASSKKISKESFLPLCDCLSNQIACFWNFNSRMNWIIPFLRDVWCCCVIGSEVPYGKEWDLLVKENNQQQGDVKWSGVRLFSYLSFIQIFSCYYKKWIHTFWPRTAESSTSYGCHVMCKTLVWRKVLPSEMSRSFSDESLRLYV